MALPDVLAARLIEAVKAYDLTGEMVMLGRQRWIGGRFGPAANLLTEAIAAHLPELREADLVDPASPYSERFFQQLGFAAVDSLDINAFEGASILQDLSAPLAPELTGRFDFVYDGGTCEHVFELPTAFRNIDAMLKPGGVLIGHSPANDYINHGYYQFGPELVYGFWEKAMGYEVLHCRLQPTHPTQSRLQIRTTNPNVTGRRARLSRPLKGLSGVMLDYAVRKPMAEVEATGRAYQGDYRYRWSIGKASNGL